MSKILDLIEEELELELKKYKENSHKLYDISDCKNCRYNLTQEELSELNEEEYINAFDKCRTCANYYTNNYEEK